MNLPWPRWLLPAGFAAALVWASARHRRASRQVRRPTAEAGRLGVLVLGCPPDKQGRLTVHQRWRIDIAARSLPSSGPVTVVISGGALQGRPAESAVMRAYAETRPEFRRPGVQILEENRARSTWENIAFGVPMLLAAEVAEIMIVSYPLHAERGRDFTRRQFPELAGRLVAADDWRWSEFPLLKLTTAVYEAVGEWRERRNPRLPA